MAKEMITFKCGHTEERSFFGPYKERARKMEWLKGQLCSECYKAEKAKAFEAVKAAEAKMADAVEATIELPELLGSEKQVAWSRAIRAKAIEQLVAVVAATEANLGSDDPRIVSLKTAVAKIESQSEAKFWIDSRDLSPKELIKQFIVL